MKNFKGENEVTLLTLSDGYISVMCSGCELGMYKLIDHQIIAYRNNNGNSQAFRIFENIKDAERWIVYSLVDQGLVA